MNALDMVEKQQLRTDIPKFRPGDTIKVHVKIREGDKERIQVFEGICIAQDLYRAETWWRSRNVHGPQDVLWTRRGTHLPASFEGHRQD